MKKILIIDTQGEAITPIYRSLLPGVKIRGVETDATRGTPCHEHGALCGWLSALPCIGAGIEIVYWGGVFEAAKGFFSRIGGLMRAAGQSEK